MNIRRLLIFIFAVTADATFAHPGDGLVVRNDNWYFVATVPIRSSSPEGPSHYAALWRWSKKEGLILNYRASHHSSNMFISQGRDGNIYVAERHYLGDSAERPSGKPGDNNVYVTRLGRLVNQEIEWLLGPKQGRKPFGAGAFIIDSDLNIYFANENSELYKRNTNGTIERLNLTTKFSSIGRLAWGPDGEIFVLDNLDVKSISKDRTTVTSFASIPRVKESEPHANDGTIIFDMVVDTNHNVYLADWGQMQVLKISPEGVITKFYQSKDDFGPEGLVLIDGKVSVFESTTPRSYGQILPRLLTLDSNGQAQVMYDFKVD